MLQRTSGVVASATTPYQADFEIHLDRTAMTASHCDQPGVTQALSRFFEAYPFFSLTDLQDVTIRSLDGKEVPLKQIATVDVWFGAARTEILVGK